MFKCPLRVCGRLRPFGGFTAVFRDVCPAANRSTRTRSPKLSPLRVLIINAEEVPYAVYGGGADLHRVYSMMRAGEEKATRWNGIAYRNGLLTMPVGLELVRDSRVEPVGIDPSARREP